MSALSLTMSHSIADLLQWAYLNFNLELISKFMGLDFMILKIIFTYPSLSALSLSMSHSIADLLKRADFNSNLQLISKSIRLDFLILKIIFT